MELPLKDKVPNSSWTQVWAAYSRVCPLPLLGCWQAQIARVLCFASFHPVPVPCLSNPTVAARPGSLPPLLPAAASASLSSGLLVSSSRVANHICSGAPLLPRETPTAAPLAEASSKATAARSISPLRADAIAGASYSLDEGEPTPSPPPAPLCLPARNLPPSPPVLQLPPPAPPEAMLPPTLSSSTSSTGHSSQPPPPQAVDSAERPPTVVPRNPSDACQLPPSLPPPASAEMLVPPTPPAVTSPWTRSLPLPLACAPVSTSSAPNTLPVPPVSSGVSKLPDTSAPSSPLPSTQASHHPRVDSVSAGTPVSSPPFLGEDTTPPSGPRSPPGGASASLLLPPPPPPPPAPAPLALPGPPQANNKGTTSSGSGGPAVEGKAGRQALTPVTLNVPSVSEARDTGNEGCVVMSAR